MLRKIGPNWVNGIGNWIVDEGYLVRMLTEDSFIVVGDVVDPVTPIFLEVGYQFISYLPETSMDALIAYETILGDNLDFVRDSEGNMLRKIGPNWVNGIGDCNPSEGYLVKMNSDAELIYPAINQPPEPPSSPNPENGAGNQSIEIDLSWTCIDPEGDPLTYDIYFGTETTPPLVNTGQTETTYDLETLANNTEYFWKIVAHDDHNNTTEGTVWSFITEPEGAQPCPGVPTVTYEGQVYNTILIGDQCWLKENLNVGTMIPGNNTQYANGIFEKYCYDNDPANCDEYGGLYQWNEMMNYSTTPGVQGICPLGWHLPTKQECTILINFLGGTNIAGGKMKETGTTHWQSPNTSATNESGFTALPGGFRTTSGDFNYLGSDGCFWASTDSYTTNAWSVALENQNSIAFLCTYGINNGISVRCLMDD